MNFLAQIPNLGWMVIAFIAILIFIVVMFRGIKLGKGDKTVFVGKSLDKRFEDFKKDIEAKDLKRLHDEELRKSLLKKSMKIDEHLMADMRRSVRRIDTAVSEIFKPFLTSPLSASVVTGLIKAELNERLDYNNVKEKLSKNEIFSYCEDIIKDIHNQYSTFYIQSGKLQEVEPYPEWEEIESKIETLVLDWSKNIVILLKCHIKEKIEMYEREQDNFKTLEYKENSIAFPIEKNKKYLENLGA